MADLTKLSDADLLALKSGDITKLSDAGLLALRGQSSPAVTPSPKPLTNDNPNPIDNALTDVIAWKMRNVDPKLPSFLRTGDPQASVQGRMIQGAADLPVGAMQLAANAVGLGDKVNSQIASTNQRTEQLRGPDAGFDFARLAGNLINPAPYSLAAKIPAATMMGRVGQGAVLGTVTGATTPISKGDFWDEKATQTAVGAGVGAAVPVAIAAVKLVGGKAVDVADLLRPGGAQRIFDKYQNNILGADEASKQKIIDALRKVEEYVPGSKPTVAEAVEGVPQASPLVSYQQSLSAAPGGPSGAFGQRMADQEAARRAALQTVGKSKSDLASAIESRSDAAKVNYGNAYAQSINADPTLAQLSKNPFFRDALPDAEILAKAYNINPKDDLTQFLHFVKIGLDRQLLPNANNALTKTQQNAINQVRADLVKWIGNKNPQYESARQVFADQSKVIDRMRVGQNLQDKLVSATGKETPSQFANAVRNEAQSIKRATGESRYQGLDELLLPQENQTVQNVLADVSRRARAFQQPQHTNLYGGLNVAEQNAPRLPNMLNTGATITNRLLKGLSDKTEKDIEKLATEVYLNPSKLADILEKAPLSQRRSLLDLLRPYAITSPIYAAAQGQ